MIFLSRMLDEHRSRFDDMLAEYREHAELGLYTWLYDVAWQGYDAYRAMLARLEQGGWPFPEVVPGATYFVMDDDHVVGEIYLRFGLTPALERDGGNIGYQVRPRARNRAYATQGLRIARSRLAERGLRSALVTCGAEHAASIRVIEKNGGVRLEDAMLPDGTVNRRYRVPCG
ncbi:GNAT family N-acetyltransferase [Vulcanimicrobium alpinum]|nr:GNAT family N-acetyltransferase [Vulcanimicrobium alpinum]